MKKWAMRPVLHGCAKTTEAVRTEIQNSKESLKTLARQHSISPITVMTWKKGNYVHDSAIRPKVRKSTVLTPEEEAICIAFCKSTLLSLDDCLYSLKETIPTLQGLVYRGFFRGMISVSYHNLWTNKNVRSSRAILLDFSILV
jgi:hypothetical protein